MPRQFTLAVALFALMAASGCSPYIDGFYYAPHPAVAQIQASTTQPFQAAESPVTAYATIVGIRRYDRERHIPLSVEVRLRLDNRGPQAVWFDPRTLDLTNSELLPFPAPIVRPMQAVSILPGQPFTIKANFPLPSALSDERGGLDTLQLRWVVTIDGHAVPQIANFRRIRRYYYYDPYWDYPPYPYGDPYVGFGGTFIFHR
jgi:hypothetical protein